MIAGLMIILAYLLPLPILGACLYFHVFDNIHDTAEKITMLAATSLGPSAVLMLMALKRIVKTAVTLALVLGGSIMAGLQHFGVLHLFGK